MNRIRLTITLVQKIIHQVDTIIDGKRLRNRSHAIEYILGEYFRTKVRQALILAGGRGTKMRPFTFEMPKAMIPIHGKPALEYTIERLREAEIRDILISVGHLGEKIKEHFGDGSKWGVKIRYVEGNDTGTAEAIRCALSLLKKETTLLWYGDVLAEIDVDDCIQFHRANPAPITMAVTSIRETTGWGVVGLAGTHVIRFVEHAEQGETTSQLINAGAYLVEPNVFDCFTGGEVSFEKDIVASYMLRRELNGYSFVGQWFDIGNPDGFERAVASWNGIKNEKHN